MPKFVRFDPAATAPILAAWYDTDFAEYPNLPPANELREMTEPEWDARLETPFVTATGELVAAPEPVIPPEAAAANELLTRRAAGIAITCTSSSAINATYALDDLTLAQVGSVARDVSSGLGFPLGAPTFNYPDITSVPHTFNETQFVDLYKSMRDLVNDMTTQAAVMAQGGTPDWPDQSATIPWASRMRSQSATVP
jgi:hypothetical protein